MTRWDRAEVLQRNSSGERAYLENHRPSVATPLERGYKNGGKLGLPADSSERVIVQTTQLHTQTPTDIHKHTLTYTNALTQDWGGAG